MSSNNNPNPSVTSIADLLSQSGLGQRSQSIIVDNLSANDQARIGTTGIAVNDLNEDDVDLVAFVGDKSASMFAYQDDVIAGYNDMLQAIRDSKLEDSIIASLWTFDSRSHLVHSYKPIANVDDLDRNTYNPNGMTALYDAVLNALTGIAAYAQDLMNNGITCRCTVVVMSDGENTVNTVATAAKVKQVAEDLLRQENFTLAFFAFGPHGRTEAARMGFPSVMETGQSGTEMRRALGTVSKSIIRASQTKISTSGASFFS